jgi:REP element-mobilizing transposase RayT
MPDHVHMLISIPPKYSVAEVIGYRPNIPEQYRQLGNYAGRILTGQSPAICR